MDSLHSHRQRTSWVRTIGIVLGGLVALALAGYVGSVVGPHLTATSASPTTSTSAPPASTTTSTVVHSTVKVFVANGTQEPNTAAHFSQQLQLQGWNTAIPGNTTSAAATTTVYYAPSKQQAAAIVASEIGAPASAVQPMSSAVPVPDTTGDDVVVVIGSDLAGTGFPATTVPAT